MDMKSEIPSKASALSAIDPRTDKGLPLLATLVGIFAMLVFLVVVFNALFGIINWNPIFWLLRVLPGFLSRALIAVVTVIGALGCLITSLAGVKTLHLLYGWRYKSDGETAEA